MKRYVAAALIALGLTTVFVVESFFPTIIAESQAAKKDDQ